ncbi:hypothetical protein GW796_01055 [archaeon]|nr:hypothetical protein [archaeon]
MFQSNQTFCSFSKNFHSEVSIKSQLERIHCLASSIVEKVFISKLAPILTTLFRNSLTSIQLASSTANLLRFLIQGITSFVYLSSEIIQSLILVIQAVT